MCCSIDFHPLVEQSRSLMLHNKQANVVSDDPCFKQDLTEFERLFDISICSHILTEDALTQTAAQIMHDMNCPFD